MMPGMSDYSGYAAPYGCHHDDSGLRARIAALEERVHALDGLPPEPKPKPQPVRGPEFQPPCPDCRVAAGQLHAEGCRMAGGDAA